MSFSNQVSEELAVLPIKKTCCKRALLLGILLGARDMPENEYISYFYEKSVRDLAADMLKRMFRSEPMCEDTVRAGRNTYTMRFSSAGVTDFFRSVERESEEALQIVAGFRCGSCQGAFLRGVFMGCGSITDPKKSYHMELIFPKEKRADFVSKMLEGIIGKPNKIKRGERFGIYYKNNNAILDFLYGIGCNHSGIYMANSFIERDIRNNENRATNCVARNISRSVGAAQKHINAIEKLVAEKKLDCLSSELRYTARLRLENRSASLYELSLMHEPPITKSGLNRRLSKIMEIAGVDNSDQN